MSWYKHQKPTIHWRQWRLMIPDNKNDVLSIRFRVARNGACVKQPPVTGHKDPKPFLLQFWQKCRLGPKNSALQQASYRYVDQTVPQADHLCNHFLSTQHILRRESFPQGPFFTATYLLLPLLEAAPVVGCGFLPGLACLLRGEGGFWLLGGNWFCTKTSTIANMSPLHPYKWPMWIFYLHKHIAGQTSETPKRPEKVNLEWEEKDVRPTANWWFQLLTSRKHSVIDIHENLPNSLYLLC